MKTWLSFAPQNESTKSLFYLTNLTYPSGYSGIMTGREKRKCPDLYGRDFFSFPSPPPRWRKTYELRPWRTQQAYMLRALVLVYAHSPWLCACTARHRPHAGQMFCADGNGEVYRFNFLYVIKLWINKYPEGDHSLCSWHFEPTGRPFWTLPTIFICSLIFLVGFVSTL